VDRGVRRARRPRGAGTGQRVPEAVSRRSIPRPGRASAASVPRIARHAPAIRLHPSITNAPGRTDAMTANEPMALIVMRRLVPHLLGAGLAACDVNVPLGNLPGDAPGALPDALHNCGPDKAPCTGAACGGTMCLQPAHVPSGFGSYALPSLASITILSL